MSVIITVVTLMVNDQQSKTEIVTLMVNNQQSKIVMATLMVIDQQSKTVIVTLMVNDQSFSSYYRLLVISKVIGKIILSTPTTCTIPDIVNKW
jgi:hypothetical protein